MDRPKIKPSLKRARYGWTYWRLYDKCNSYFNELSPKKQECLLLFVYVVAIGYSCVLLYIIACPNYIHQLLLSIGLLILAALLVLIYFCFSITPSELEELQTYNDFKEVEACQNRLKRAKLRVKKKEQIINDFQSSNNPNPVADELRTEFAKAKEN